MRIALLEYNVEMGRGRINEIGMVYHQEDNRPADAQREMDEIQAFVDLDLATIKELKNDI